jgi:hypothetical protein
MHEAERIPPGIDFGASHGSSVGSLELGENPLLDPI